VKYLLPVILLLLFIYWAWANVSLAAPASGGSGDIPTADEILDMLGGRGKSIDFNSVTSGIITWCLKIIRLLQVIAVPGAVLFLVIAAFMYATGTLGHNDNLKRRALGIAFGAVIGFAVIRLAPVLVAGMFNAVQ